MGGLPAQFWCLGGGLFQDIRAFFSPRVGLRAHIGGRPGSPLKYGGPFVYFPVGGALGKIVGAVVLSFWLRTPFGG